MSASLVLCCLGTPAAGLFVWVGLPILQETIDAGKGQSTPMVALELLFETFENPDGDFLAPRYIVRSRRDEVLKVRSKFMNDRRADEAAHPDEPIGELKIAGPQPGDPPADFGALSGDRTTVVAYYAWHYPATSTTGQELTMSSGGLPWKAEARKESDGWRIWSLEIPSWCGAEGDAKSGYKLCKG